MKMQIIMIKHEEKGYEKSIIVFSLDFPRFYDIVFVKSNEGGL